MVSFGAPFQMYINVDSKIHHNTLHKNRGGSLAKFVSFVVLIFNAVCTIHLRCPILVSPLKSNVSVRQTLYNFCYIKFICCTFYVTVCFFVVVVVTHYFFGHH